MKKFGIYMLKLLIAAVVFAVLAVIAVIIFLMIAFSDMPVALAYILVFGTGGGMLAGYIAFVVWLGKLWKDTPEQKNPAPQSSDETQPEETPAEETDAQDKSAFSGIEIWRKIKSPLLIMLPVAAIFVLILSHNEIEYRYERHKARNAVAAADEVIRYENDGDVYVHLMGTDLIQASAAINYKKMQVAFIYSMSYAQAKYVNLDRTSALPKKYIQFKSELKSPGKYFYTYYPEDAKEYWDYCRTCGVGIEMEDGSCWYAGFEKEALDFNAISARIAIAMENAEVIIPYGEKPLSAVCMGLESDSVLIDFDEMTLSVVHAYTEQGFPEARGLVNYEINADIPLAEITEDEHITKQREIEYEGYTLYGYRDSKEGQWDKDRSDGFIVITPDGRMYEADKWGYYNFTLAK